MDSLGDGDRGQKLAMFCGTALTNNTLKLAVHALVVIFLCLSLYLMVLFASKREYFPVRERAPRLALLQASVYLLTVASVYVAEVCIELGFDWTDWTADDEKALESSQLAFKYVYLALRLNIYLIFLLR